MVIVVGRSTQSLDVMSRPFAMRDPKVLSWLAVIAVVALAVGTLLQVSAWLVVAGVVSWSWAALHNSIVEPRLIDQAPRYTWPQGMAVGIGVVLIVAGLVSAIIRFTVVNT